jgi:hypothetical protein
MTALTDTSCADLAMGRRLCGNSRHLAAGDSSQEMTVQTCPLSALVAL